MLHLRLWNLNSTSNSPVAPLRLSCQVAANQHEAATSSNVNKHWKTRAKGNDVITNYIIFANRYFASTFPFRYSNSRDVVASSPFFSDPAARVPWRACSGGRGLFHKLDIFRKKERGLFIWSHQHDLRPLSADTLLKRLCHGCFVHFVNITNYSSLCVWNLTLT